VAGAGAVGGLQDAHAHLAGGHGEGLFLAGLSWKLLLS
jgi:hypothetical protein